MSVRKWKGKEGLILPRIQLIMEELVKAKPNVWITNEEIRNQVESDQEIARILGEPIDSGDAMIMLNWISRGYSQIDRLLEAHAKGLTVEEMVDKEAVPSYSFSKGGLQALTDVHRRFLRSAWRPFAYRLREASK